MMFFKKRFDKYAIPAPWNVLKNWPGINPGNLSDKDFDIYEKREKAVRAYLAEDLTVEEIESKHGINRATLYRLVKRCLKDHKDGRIWGFRALIPRIRLEPYQRMKALKSKPAHRQGGYAGAMGMHLDQWPESKEFLDDEFLQIDTSKTLREYQIPYKRIHSKWLKKLKNNMGLTQKDWPFSTSSQGITSLKRYLKRLFNENYVAATKAREGDAAAKKLKVGTGKSSKLSVTRILRTAEFDGHKIDAIFAIIFKHPMGGEMIRTLKRFYLLFIIDTTSRAILGYYVSLRKEYSGEDVLRCVRNAIIPWEPLKLTIPGLKYEPDGGLPSGKIKRLAYACWSQLLYDNAKANIAYWVRRFLRRRMGFMINSGQAGFADGRPFVERFFKTLEENGFHRLPNTTGSGPKDKRRKKPEDAAIQYRITIEQLYEILDVLVANYNATPHQGNLGRTPLEVLEFMSAEENCQVRIIPADQRDRINFLEKPKEVTVRGNIKKGLRPYINYKGARYTGPILANMPHMIREKIDIIPNPDHQGMAQACHKSGEEIEVLTAQGPFGQFTHDEKTRDLILKLMRDGEIKKSQMDDPIEALLEYLRGQAVTNRSAANEIARIENADFYKRIPQKRGDEHFEHSTETDQQPPEPHPVNIDNNEFNPEKLKKKVRVH